MTRWVWVLGGLLGCAACTGDTPGVEGDDAREQQRKQLQACIITQAPPPEGASTSQWTVSGYALVVAYRGCQSKPEDATAANFREVIRGLAEPEEDPSRVRLTRPTGSPP